MIIRRLSPLDVEPFRRLRLKALLEEPTAFASSHEEEVRYDPAVHARWLAVEPDRGCLGAFDGASLVGIVTLGRETKAKLRHKAAILGLYVHPQWRCAGVAQALLTEALALADQAPGLRQVNVGVMASNAPARRLYEKAGFRPYGVEPNAMLVDGRPYDELLLWLPLPLPRTGAHAP